MNTSWGILLIVDVDFDDRVRTQPLNTATDNKKHRLAPESWPLNFKHKTIPNILLFAYRTFRGPLSGSHHILNEANNSLAI